MADVKIIFAQNLISLRKQMKLTQIELAEKLNYSDKAVSKWERGESIPDVTVLMDIAKTFGVTLDFLVSEHDQPEIAAEQSSYAQSVKKKNRLLVTAITVFAMAVIETIVFVVLQSIFKNIGLNLVYCYVFPLPAVAIVMIVFTSLWCSKKIYRFASVTGLIVSVLLDAFLIAYIATNNFYPWIFLVLIPAELVTMFSFKIIRISSKRTEDK